MCCSRCICCYTKKRNCCGCHRSSSCAVWFGLVWFFFLLLLVLFLYTGDHGSVAGVERAGRAEEVRRIQKPHEKFLIHQHPLLFCFLSLFSVLLLYKSLTVFGLVAPLLVAPLSLSVCSFFFPFFFFLFFLGAVRGEKRRGWGFIKSWVTIEV